MLVYGHVTDLFFFLRRCDKLLYFLRGFGPGLLGFFFLHSLRLHFAATGEVVTVAFLRCPLDFIGPFEITTFLIFIAFLAAKVSPARIGF